MDKTQPLTFCAASCLDVWAGTHPTPCIGEATTSQSRMLVLNESYARRTLGTYLSFPVPLHAARRRVDRPTGGLRKCHIFCNDRLPYFRLTLRLTYRRRGGRLSANRISGLYETAEGKARAALRCRRIVRHPVAALILRCALLLAVTFVLTHETQQTAKKVDHQSDLRKNRPVTNASGNIPRKGSIRIAFTSIPILQPLTQEG